jgi:hypothetical protein
MLTRPVQNKGSILDVPTLRIWCEVLCKNQFWFFFAPRNKNKKLINFKDVILFFI